MTYQDMIEREVRTLRAMKRACFKSDVSFCAFTKFLDVLTSVTFQRLLDLGQDSEHSWHGSDGQSAADRPWVSEERDQRRGRNRSRDSTLGAAPSGKHGVSDRN